jgi:hypothetical protein
MYKVLVVLLTVLFVGLKLTNYIDWSWWWVVSPIWISFLVGLTLVGGLTALFMKLKLK